MDWRRIAAWAGMIGPPLFFGIVMLEGWIRPGYDSLLQYGSELSLGPRGWIQIANEILFGILSILLSLGLAVDLRGGRAARIGPALIGIVGVSHLIAGVFITDPVFPPATVHGQIHAVNGLVVFILMPISCFALVRRFREDPRWRWLYPWTLATGLVNAVLAVAILVPLFFSVPIPVVSDWPGLMQRVYLLCYLAWLFAVGINMHSQTNAVSKTAA